MPFLEYTFLTERIAKPQQFIRSCVYKTLVNNKVTGDKANLYSQSTVSQRDIQRVFRFFDWLLKWFKRPTKYDRNDFSVSCRAVFVALALVYYFRLNEQSRQQFKNEMSKICLVDEQSIPVTFEQAVSDEFDWVSDHINLPIDIAPTDALKENIYAIIVCTMTHIPVIIVGPPGSSKIGVANDILDTVTSNQAVVVYKSEMFQNDLMQIADCCLTNTQPSNLAKEVVIDGFVKAYECIIQQDSIDTLFGVMDFTHFLTYIDKVASQTNIVSSEIVVQSLEINFNGSNYFNEILTAFLDEVSPSSNFLSQPISRRDWSKQFIN